MPEDRFTSYLIVYFAFHYLRRSLDFKHHFILSGARPIDRSTYRIVVNGFVGTKRAGPNFRSGWRRTIRHSDQVGAWLAASCQHFDLPSAWPSGCAVSPGSQGFSSNVNRDVVDLDEIVDRPLAMLKPILQSCSRWEDVVHVATSLRRQIAEVPLDWGICQNDLGLRNVHVAGDQLLIFDLDGSTEGWRALEAVGAYEAPNRNCWPAWLAGYREVRTFSLADEHAVPIFTLLAQLQRTAWKLGLTDISVGQLMTPEELPIVVDEWLCQFEQIQ